MKKVVGVISCSVLLMATAITHAAIIIDFDAAAGVATQVGNITVDIDIGTDGVATLNNISGSITNPTVVVSGFVSAAPTTAYTMTLVMAGSSNLRQTGGGEIGVGNNFVDAGQSISYSFNVDDAQAGSSLNILGFNINGSTAGDGSIAGISGTTNFSWTVAGDVLVDTTGINTSVAQGSGQTLAATVTGASGQHNLNSLTVDVIPEPMTFGMIGAGTLFVMFLRRMFPSV